MWKSVYTDLYNSLEQNGTSPLEKTVLAIHCFNVAQGMQCTGLREGDPLSDDILPEGWKANT